MRERFHHSGLFFYHSGPIQSRQFKRKIIYFDICYSHFVWRPPFQQKVIMRPHLTLQPSLGPSDIVNYSGERLFSCRRQPGIRLTSLRANTAISFRSSPIERFRRRFFVRREFLSPRNARSLVAKGWRRDGCICRLKIDHFCFYIVLWTVCLLPVTRYKVNWKLNVLKRHDSQKRKDFAV